jgi:hypothetical protein
MLLLLLLLPPLLPLVLLLLRDLRRRCFSDCLRGDWH